MDSKRRNGEKEEQSEKYKDSIEILEKKLTKGGEEGNECIREAIEVLQGKRDVQEWVKKRNNQ